MANASEDDYTKYLEYQSSVVIWKTIPPILILFGTVGNILSIIVLTRKSIRKSTTALYLTFLAASDISVLYTGLLRQWLFYLVEYDLRHTSEAACKIHLWLVYSSLDFSAWILMALTLERLMATWCPFRARRVCSRLNAASLVMAMLFLILAINSHFMYGMIDKTNEDDYGNVTDIERCLAVDEKYTGFFNNIWPWIDLGTFCVFPLSVILIGNICILSKVMKSQRRMSSSSLHHDSPHRCRHLTSRGHKLSSLTAMLLVLNTVFIITTLPVSIYNIGYSHWLAIGSPRTYALLELWWAIVNMLMYTNNAINFLLYCLSGSKFRHEAKLLFFPQKVQRRETVVGNVTQSEALSGVTKSPSSNFHDVKFCYQSDTTVHL